MIPKINVKETLNRDCLVYIRNNKGQKNQKLNLKMLIILSFLSDRFKFSKFIFASVTIKKDEHNRSQ